MKQFLSLISITDDFDTPIKLNDNFVHMANESTLQVTRDLREKYTQNNLHLVIRLAPEMLKVPKMEYQDGTNKPTDESKQAVEDYLDNTQVDLPAQLLECLMLGIGAKAHSMGFLSNDARTGTASVVNPYLERYELAIKKAKENGFVHQTGLESRTVYTKGFI